MQIKKKKKGNVFKWNYFLYTEINKTIQFDQHLCISNSHIPQGISVIHFFVVNNYSALLYYVVDLAILFYAAFKAIEYDLLQTI